MMTYHKELEAIKFLIINLQAQCLILIIYVIKNLQMIHCFQEQVNLNY